MMVQNVRVHQGSLKESNKMNELMILNKVSKKQQDLYTIWTTLDMDCWALKP